MINKKKIIIGTANFFKSYGHRKSKVEKSEIIKKYKPIGIFNLAAETHVDRSIDGPENFIKTNIYGTFGLLESLRFLQKKKLLLSLFIFQQMKYSVILNMA